MAPPSRPQEPDFTKENPQIIAALMQSGLQDPAVLERISAWMQEKTPVPVGKRLVEEGFISRERFVALVENLSSKILYCTGCDAFQPAEPPLSEAACARCGRRLAFFEFLDGEEIASGPDRYEPGPEIGRGGLGRVLSATDRVLGREVAVKEMMKSADSPSLCERFLREGRIAGRFVHPNIVPVYDVGVREEKGRKVPYFVMGKIRGRDLQAILLSLRSGDEDAKGLWTLHRLLRVFQEVCMAMAFAHDQGVIHRDLKPGNIMVGDYGEVYVVDWGLAKILGGPDFPDPPSPESSRARAPVETDPPDSLRTTPSDPDKEIVLESGSVDRSAGPASRKSHTSPTNLDRGRGEDHENPSLTMEGEILGTPAYMSPEQAAGQRTEVDKLSDVYSLGAILYEILTLEAPFKGDSAGAVITQVLSGALIPPSRVQAGSSAPKRVGEIAPLQLNRRVPEELEDVVMKSMSREKEKRFSSVKEIHDEIQEFLEGEKERELNHLRAMESVAEGKTLVERMEAQGAELESLEKQASERGKEIKPFWPAKRKKDFWVLLGKVKTTRLERARTFSEATNAFQEALGFERKNSEARASLADLFWAQFQTDEAKGNEEEMIRLENLVSRYNDGQYDARLRGDGKISIATRVYPCTCLAEGRESPPEEMGVMGHHPLSGRVLEGWKGGEGVVALETSGPVRLRVHGAECRTKPLEGADTWLFRFKERERILYPSYPDDLGIPGSKRMEPPSHLLDLAFAPRSPYRPREGLYLGRTPLEDLPIPMGSYLLLIHKEGFVPLRVPVFVGRLAEERVLATLYSVSEIPEGFIPICAGKSVFQGDTNNPYSGPREISETDDVFVAEFPVTCREYLEFLNDVVRDDPEQAGARVPRETENAGYYWPLEDGGKYVVPTREWRAGARAQSKEHARRLMEAPVDWEEDWPVFGVSWLDLMEYAAWRRRKTAYLFSLPLSVLWEKAARGADGRIYPWGNEFDPTFCNSNQTHEDGTRPCPVDSFPLDESPYGVRGLGGNSRDVCLNGPGEQFPAWCVSRGGDWSFSGFLHRCASQTGDTLTYVHNHFGGRLVLFPNSRIR